MHLEIRRLFPLMPLEMIDISPDHSKLFIPILQYEASSPSKVPTRKPKEVLQSKWLLAAKFLVLLETQRRSASSECLEFRSSKNPLVSCLQPQTSRYWQALVVAGTQCIILSAGNRLGGYPGDPRDVCREQVSVLMVQQHSYGVLSSDADL